MPNCPWNNANSHLQRFYENGPILQNIRTKIYHGWSRASKGTERLIYIHIDPHIQTKDNDEEVKKVGIRVCIDMCKKLLDNGVPYLHFYTLNLEQSVTNILGGLNIISKDQIYK